MVRVVVESARVGGRSVRRPYFGATVQAVSVELAPTVGLDRPAGVLVARVLDKGPAAEAGLKRGDVILAVDGQSVDDPDAFGFRFATKPLGGTVTLTVHRAGKRLALPVGLALAPETRPRDPVTVAGRSPLTGVKALNLSPAVADEFSLDPTSEGVVVADIEERSQAARLGFQRGDVLLAVNGVKLEDTRALERAMRERAGAWRITLERGGQVLTSAFGGG